MSWVVTFKTFKQERSNLQPKLYYMGSYHYENKVKVPYGTTDITKAKVYTKESTATKVCYNLCECPSVQETDIEKINDQEDFEYVGEL